MDFDDYSDEEYVPPPPPVKNASVAKSPPAKPVSDGIRITDNATLAGQIQADYRFNE